MGRGRKRGMEERREKEREKASHVLAVLIMLPMKPFISSCDSLMLMNDSAICN